MAKKNYNKSNGKDKMQNFSKKENKVEKFPSNEFVMKVLVFLGVAMLFVAILYLMNYFFVEKNYIKINMSTDKKAEFIKVNGADMLITTQKYVSDLNYSMRYDINSFSVFKYKKQDIFKFSDAEKILLVVEQSEIPNSCSLVTSENEYTNCVVNLDSYTEERYLSTNTRTYKITIKTPNLGTNEEEIKAKINYMLNSFEMTDK